MRTPILLLSFGLMTTSLPGAEPKPLPQPSASLSKFEHLQAAADHLKSAGLVADADRITAEAERIRKEVAASLAQKREQAAALLGEIRQLEQDLGQVKTIQLKARAVEFDGRHLRQAAGLLKDDPLMWTNPDQQKELVRLVQQLIDQRLAKVVAEATVITTDGRPATMLSGGQIPMVSVGDNGRLTINYRDVGTRLEVLPVGYDADRLRLDIAFEQSARDPSSSLLIDGQAVPLGMSMQRVNTQLDLNYGETIICGGFGLIRPQPVATPFVQLFRCARSAAIQLASGETIEGADEGDSEHVSMMLVTPEIVQPIDAAR